MPAFMADLRARDAVAARALEFLILTNVRTDAVLKATWDEFDLDQAVWTVPLVNLKDRKHRTEGFRVPASRARRRDRAPDAPRAASRPTSSQDRPTASPCRTWRS